MAPTRRRYLAVAASAITLAGCQSGTDDAGTPDGDGGGENTEAAGDNGGGNGNGGGDGNGDGDGNGAAEAGDMSRTVQVSEHPEYGEILVDSEGMALYMFDSDAQGSGESTCTDGCLDAWPALTVEEEATAGELVDAELSTFERENGDTQVAANGWPLYYFESDSEPGDVEGQGANDVWWLLDPSGEPIRESADGEGESQESAATVQVHDHEEHGEIFVDSEGMTLYMFDSDTQDSGESTCTDGCLDAWPPLTVEDEPSAGDGVEAELTTFEREDGDTQVAANGWPLYYFDSDSEPGDVEGQGANDVWWILDPAGEPIRPSDGGEETEKATTEGDFGY